MSPRFSLIFIKLMYFLKKNGYYKQPLFEKKTTVGASAKFAKQTVAKRPRLQSKQTKRSRPQSDQTVPPLQANLSSKKKIVGAKRRVCKANGRKATLAHKAATFAKQTDRKAIQPAKRPVCQNKQPQSGKGAKRPDHSIVRPDTGHFVAELLVPQCLKPN